MTPRLLLQSHPAGRALLALPLLALLASGAHASELPGSELALDAIADSDLTPRGQRAFEQARAGLEESLSGLASNLEGQLETDDVKAAEALFGLERRAISLLQYIETHDVASGGITHEQTVGGVRSMLQRILRYQERVKEHAQDKLDKVLPGEPGRRMHIRFKRTGLLKLGRSLMQELGLAANDLKFAELGAANDNAAGKGAVREGHYDVFLPLFRQGTPKPGEAAVSDEQRFGEMQADFLAKGGDVKRDIKLLGIRYLQRLDSGKLAEWTQIGESKISITTEGAKHPIIGGGRAVRGAGSVKIYRDHEGEVVLAIVSNSSGNYKPGVSSVEGLVGKLIDLGVQEERILTTSVVPEEPELVKLLLKARLNMTKEQISEHVAELMVASKPEELDRVGRSHRVFAPSQLKLPAAKVTTTTVAAMTTKGRTPRAPRAPR